MAEPVVETPKAVVAGAGSESSWAPSGFTPVDPAIYTATLMSGISAIDAYRSFATSSVMNLVADVPTGVPDWAVKIAGTGGLWKPMELEAGALIASVEAVASKSFESVKAQVGQVAQYAELTKSGLEIAVDLDELRNAASVPQIVKCVGGLCENSVEVVQQFGKTFESASGLAADALAVVPWVGFVAKALVPLFASLFPEKAPEPNPRDVLIKLQQAEGQALQAAQSRCQTLTSRVSTPQMTGTDPATGKPYMTPGDLFRPIAYWMQESVNAYVAQSATYTGPFGGRGLMDEAHYPAPPMTPMWFYVALCGDVLPPMLRPTSCNIRSYKKGTEGQFVTREPVDCYTAAIRIRQQELKAKGVPNWDKFGIPRPTRELMWKLIQAILSSVRSPLTGSFYSYDNGLAFYATLQQICYNEYLSGRIDEPLLGLLNLDLTSRNGFTGVKIKEDDPGFYRWSSVREWPARATCYDVGTVVTKTWWDSLGEFQRTSLGPFGGKTFYDADSRTWKFDQSVMRALRGSKRPSGALVIDPAKANKAVLASLTGATKARLAEGPIPWVALLGAGGFGAWWYLRNKARGGKR